MFDDMMWKTSFIVL